MSEYTDYLEWQAETLSPEEDGYEEKLLEIASYFRSFGEALTAFLVAHGFDGETARADQKVDFLRRQFRAAGIPAPNRMKEWFKTGKRIGRETAFQLCFAFDLSLDETNNFFREVCLERSFDCHSIPEAVYYFCIRNGKNYADARDILSRMPEDRKGNIAADQEILYTGTIIDFIDNARDAEELIGFVEDHLAQFGYNNATAVRHIRKRWEEISREDGLAYREGLLREAANISGGERQEAYTTVDRKPDSTWRIYAQIMGLDRYQTTQYGRTLKHLLAGNDLLPPLAEASFPDRDGIEKITGGVHVSHERIRKTLILLEFYTYWAKASVRAGTILGTSSPAEAGRCVAQMNSYLLEAGYPELYPGNPYDWIFLWAIQDDRPLDAFRDYMLELFAYQSEHGTDGQAT